MLLHAMCKNEIHKTNRLNKTIPQTPPVVSLCGLVCCSCCVVPSNMSHVHSIRYMAVTVPNTCHPRVPMFNLRTMFLSFPHQLAVVCFAAAAD